MNFLTRLAQRNLGIANLVHPRLPSTFEPVNEGANMLSAVEEVPLASPPDLPSLVRSSPVSGHAEQSTRSHAQTIRNEGEQARGATRDSTDVADADREDAPVQSHSPLSIRPLSSALDDDKSSQGGRRTDRVLSPNPEGNRGADAVSQQPLVSRSRDLPSAPPISAKAQSDLLVAAHARQAYRDDFGLEGMLPIEAETSAPTVHISIGRIEVRAHIAPSPQAPRPRAERPPTRSLADYLKRGGGTP